MQGGTECTQKHGRGRGSVVPGPMAAAVLVVTRVMMPGNEDFCCPMRKVYTLEAKMGRDVQSTALVVRAGGGQAKRSGQVQV